MNEVAVWVVYCWLRHSVDIVGVAKSECEAVALAEDYINSHPDPDWERSSGERRNNTLIERHVVAWWDK